jgi:hypothetical protein
MLNQKEDLVYDLIKDDEVLVKIGALARLHYPLNDLDHGWNTHIHNVIETALDLVKLEKPDLDVRQLVVACMYHDSALMSMGRVDHEIYSSYIVERELHKMLSPEAVENITTAIIDHRDSKKYVRKVAYGTPWRNIYSDYLATADRSSPHRLSTIMLFEKAIAHTIHQHTGEHLNDRLIHVIASTALQHIQEKYVEHTDLLPPTYSKVYKNALDLHKATIKGIDILTVEEMVRDFVEDGMIDKFHYGKQGERLDV